MCTRLCRIFHMFKMLNKIYESVQWLLKWHGVVKILVCNFFGLLFILCLIDVFTTSLLKAFVHYQSTIWGFWKRSVVLGVSRSIFKDKCFSRRQFIPLCCLFWHGAVINIVVGICNKCIILFWNCTMRLPMYNNR